MGIGMMLGLAQKISDGIRSVLLKIFTALINAVVVPLVKVIINIVIVIIKYMTSIVFLEISKFLLGLIDFVEALFRSLAGLGAKNTGVSITMALGGREGDLLISMLTSSEVIEAFYSTAIVGIFLLIITTIFQMIKVEYTTEGANNSKGGIIGKSLKSLCNMLIIPILCILGVFIGNQVLDLIDTATGGGEGTTISAQLWVTAGSEALVKRGSLLETGYFEDVTNDSSLVGPAIVLAFETILKDIVFAVTDDESAKDSTANKNLYSTAVGEPVPDEAHRKLLEKDYLEGKLSIYDTKQMLMGYNPFEVNYLVLIFGACIIIKCLYYTCFGLIDRLYQCTALFIVMPMVVGMTPVKDSLGSWRSKFMSKALSAYGTVISLNLFFIIVKVMLNIDITVAGKTNGAAGTILSLFSSSFWEGLIKSIMVIVGCLMIEKLAGDLGGYFGGGNAMADGKALSSEAMSGVTNAAKLAGGVAMGGAKLAIKGVGGIAGKIKDSDKASGLDSAVLNASASVADKESAYRDSNKNLNDVMAKNGIDDELLGAYANAQENIDKNNNIIDNAQGNIDAANASKAQAQAVLNDNSSSMAEREAARQQIAEADKSIAENEAIQYNAQGEVLNWEAVRDDFEKDNTGVGDAYSALKTTEDAKQDLDNANAGLASAQNAQKDYYAQKEAEKAQKSAERKAKFVKAKEGTRQLLEDKFGVGAMFNTFAPKPLQQLKKDYDGAVKTAMDASPEGQAMMSMLDKSKKDKAEAGFDKRNADAIEARNLAQTQLILKTTNDKLQVTNEETNKELGKMNDTLLELISKMEKARNAGNDTEAGMYASRIGNLQDAMVAKNGQIKFGDDLKVVSEEMLKVDFKMDANFMKKIEKQVKKGVKMDDIMEQISEEFKKMGINDKDALAKIYKALDELRSNFSGK